MNVLDRFRLEGKVALVTGGSGLVGRQVVEALVEAGANVLTASRNATKGKHAGITTFQFDQGDAKSIDQLAEQVIRHARAVDILVNNAVFRPMKDWDDPAEDFAASMRVNATGLFLVLRAFGNHMAERGRGSIINIGSIQGSVGPDYSLYEGLDWGAPPDYFFHKGGMVQLTRFAAAKLGPRGVRVNCVSPGGFFNSQDATFVQRYNARTFLGRMAGATDLQGAIVFLASDASAYVTGANIPVDGGYTAK
jgi:NAD(P)-dependent dehydrogenase (short-subunit alcohol dehydrogenase family)